MYKLVLKAFWLLGTGVSIIFSYKYLSKNKIQRILLKILLLL